MKHINDLSAQWLRLAAWALRSPNHEVSPAVATIEFNSATDLEKDSFRTNMDCLLDKCGYDSTDTVATTIFPYFLWNRRANRNRLFDRYFALLPIIRKHNPRGVYFERMISHPGVRGVKGFNQLDHVITTYLRGNHRRSALQISLVDPKSDLNNDARVLGFPCLHQLGFLPDSQTRTMTVLAYYPTQYLLRRAYGNYLGLARLGEFVAHETGLHCNKLICIAGVAMVENHTRDVRRLVSAYTDAQ